jgi:hypothetical protein
MIVNIKEEVYKVFLDTVVQRRSQVINDKEYSFKKIKFKG